MSSLCLYFQVHQPFRIRRFSFFESSREFYYFDEFQNRDIAQKVAQKCYLPANNLMLDLINRYNGRFRIAYSITGLAIEQMWKYCPEVLDSFKKLSDTGCVEFLAETYYHSLASLYDTEEFVTQIRQHSELIKGLFGQTPTVFRNTELIFDDRIGSIVNQMGFKGILAEGVDNILAGRSPNFLYRSSQADLKILLKNYRYSDDIAFRFSNTSWEHFPLTPEKFANWLHQHTDHSQVINLFMDYETFGEHQWEVTGIFDFMNRLPENILSNPAWSFDTPSEIISKKEPVDDISFYRTTSWADSNRDLSAWQGNRMQLKALDSIHELKKHVRTANDPYITETWKKLQTSDHFYYMSTKPKDDGNVHAYFSPYESPYDAFINYMNVVRDFKGFVMDAAANPKQTQSPQLNIEKIIISSSNGDTGEEIISVPLEQILETSIQ